jgi:uncharacterized membrane protein/Zn ribbon nucleic-acid-binding protein
MSKKTPRSARQDAAKGAASSPREPRANARQIAAPPRTTLPNRPLLGLSLAGIAVAGYLTYTGWTGAQAAYCEAGGGCDVVQSSQWATFLGVPTAFWGLLTYAALAFIATRVKRPNVQWQRAWVVGMIGFAVSVYLTAISVLVLQATCPYCLASLAIFTAIVGLLAWQRPESIPRFAWPRWLLQTGVVALIAIGALHLQSTSNAAAGQEDPYLSGLAAKLTESGAMFYGASWCPHCQQQKAMFGASEERLPYVECSPGGPRAPSAPSCIRARVETYPTWIFANGDRVTGVIPLSELAQRVGYEMASEAGGTP